QLLRQKKIACIARLHRDNVTAVPQLVNVFLKNDLHIFSLSSCFFTLVRAYAFGASAAGGAGLTGAGVGVTCAGADCAVAAPGTTTRGACVPAALPANGNKAMLRARLMATPNQGW